LPRRSGQFPQHRYRTAAVSERQADAGRSLDMAACAGFPVAGRLRAFHPQIRNALVLRPDSDEPIFDTGQRLSGSRFLSMWEHASPHGGRTRRKYERVKPRAICGNERGPSLSFGGEMESREECLREAAECDRLAQLANTQGTRTLLAVAAFQWRKLAERAAERQKRSWPLMPEAVRPN